MVIFCEGTRFTPEKHAKSVAFSEKNGLPVLRHLLFPRLKGFQLMRDELRDVEHVLNVTFAFPAGVPSLRDLVIDAKTIEVHGYIGSVAAGRCGRAGGLAMGVGRWRGKRPTHARSGYMQPRRHERRPHGREGVR